MTDRKGSFMVAAPAVDVALLEAWVGKWLRAELAREKLLRDLADETGATLMRTPYSPYCRAPGCCDWEG